MLRWWSTSFHLAHLSSNFINYVTWPRSLLTLIPFIIIIIIIIIIAIWTSTNFVCPRSCRFISPNLKCAISPLTTSMTTKFTYLLQLASPITLSIRKITKSNTWSLCPLMNVDIKLSDSPSSPCPYFFLWWVCVDEGNRRNSSTRMDALINCRALSGYVNMNLLVTNSAIDV